LYVKESEILENVKSHAAGMIGKKIRFHGKMRAAHSFKKIKNGHRSTKLKK